MFDLQRIGVLPCVNVHQLPSLWEQCGVIHIYNNPGVRVLTTPFLRDTHSDEGDIRIDVSQLLAGVYFVRVGDWVGSIVKI